MYNYTTEKPQIFTERGMEMFLKVRDKADKFLGDGGAFQMGHVMSASSGDSWTLMACVDRLVEIGEIREIPQNDCAGQHRTFVSVYER